MKTDFATKVILSAIAVGLFLNAFALMFQPQPANAVCYDTATTEIWELGSCLEDVRDELSGQLDDIQSIASNSESYIIQVYLNQ
jgi:hypothetical protein